MPIHLPPLGRRQFLKTAAATAAGVLTLGCEDRALAPPVPAAGEHRLALLADTHIAADEKVETRDVKMAANLRRVVEEIKSLPDKPAAVLIDGDCAHLKGLQDDYRLMGRLIEPLRERYPIHLTLGNHDDREQFYGVLADLTPAEAERPVQSKHVAVLKMPGANWFLLDSLQEVNKTPGEVGEAQRRWLAAALDEHQGTPAIIMVHHNPQYQPREEPARVTGLVDTAELFDILRPRTQVKAVVYGHTHDWKLRQEEGIHLINLPPVAYVFDKKRPNGWVHGHIKPDGITLRLHALDSAHPQANQTATLRWRE